MTRELAAKPVPHNCDQEELPFDEIAESLGEGTSMTVTHVDRSTGEIHDATVVGRGVRL